MQVWRKLEDLEPFYPDRMAPRILGMGDVLSLIEKAQAAFDEKKAMELQKKLKNQQFTFDDFLDQLQQMKKMGPLSSIIEMIPGLNPSKLKGLQVDDRELIKVEAIIKSMTKKERQNPDIIKEKKVREYRRERTSIQYVNRVMKNFEQTKRMMKQFAGMEKDMKKGKMKMPFFR